MINLSNNIFYYATSELSQDAFICYLVSFLLEDNIKKNEAINMCAVDFINVILQQRDSIRYGEAINNVYKQGEIFKPAINKQYKSIDVYLIINDWHIIIEDKTFTYVHGDQINRYTQVLKDEGIPDNKIIKVFYKTIEQYEKENDANLVFDRKSILRILSKYVDKCNDKIFTDYVEYLQSIDNETQEYISKTIDKWTYLNYVGFFTKIMNDKIVHNADDEHWGAGWGYVPNAKGGFMALWWIPQINKDISKKLRSGLYLQIEDNRIVLKLYNYEIEDKDNEKEIIDKRWELKYKIIEFVENLNCKELIKGGRISIATRSTTFYYKYYNENNFTENILFMENLFKQVVQEIKKFIFNL